MAIHQLWPISEQRDIWPALSLGLESKRCQKETPDFLWETIALCRQLTDKPLLIRLNSSNDASENIGIFMEESCKYNHVSFIIKRNPWQESREEWLASVKDCCQNIQTPRDERPFTLDRLSGMSPIRFRTEMTKPLASVRFMR